MPNRRRAELRKALKAVRRYVSSFSKRLRLMASFGILDHAEIKDMQKGLKSLEDMRTKLRNRIREMEG